MLTGPHLNFYKDRKDTVRITSHCTTLHCDAPCILSAGQCSSSTHKCELGVLYVSKGLQKEACFPAQVSLRVSNSEGGYLVCV